MSGGYDQTAQLGKAEHRSIAQVGYNFGGNVSVNNFIIH